MSDLVRYWYAALFLFASAYTLFDEGHVRVDVFYAGFKNKTRGFVNAFGSIFPWYQHLYCYSWCRAWGQTIHYQCTDFEF